MLHGPGFSETPPEGWAGVDFPGDGIVRQIQGLTYSREILPGTDLLKQEIPEKC